jgi:preprotein translocase subunit SecD
MITARRRFNVYLLAVVGVALVCGCQTRSDKKSEQKSKAIATLRVHLEVIPESMDFSTSVPIYRKQPVMVTVDKASFLTEGDVAEAKVVDVDGGFDLQIKFDRHGTWLFEEYTTTNPGKHYAVFSTFGEKKKQGRWLGAPIIKGRISNGLLTFVPDATREEAEEIARGLNNVAKKNSNDTKW